IGMCTNEADLCNFLGGDAHGWGFIGDRALYHRRSKVQVYGDRYGCGDVIGCRLDLDAGTLSFSKNGIDLGPAF
ncbi:concanavalin A-like lectin/glucanase domain-containing protein, partial [Pelagophyceae sp. CCMP2097]